MSITRTYNQTSTAGSTDLKIVRTETALGSGAHRFLDFYSGTLGTTNVFSVTNSGLVNATNATFAAGIITSSQPFSITQTWNNSGVTFDAVLVNVSDSAGVGSASGSRLLRLARNGTDYVTRVS